LHTAFDYIFDSHKNQRTCGKVTAKWLQKMGDVHIGGIPPSLDVIKHKKDHLRRFVQELFGHEKFFTKDIINLLAANFL